MEENGSDKKGLNVKFDKTCCHVYSPEGELLTEGELNRTEGE